MKKLALISLALLVLLAPIAGCHGPQKLTRGLDEWVNNGYMESPWMYGNVISHVLLGFANIVTWVVDSFINPYYFWFSDAWPAGDGKGTAYPFKMVTPTRK
jgi:hypothetical protein